MTTAKPPVIASGATSAKEEFWCEKTMKKESGGKRNLVVHRMTDPDDPVLVRLAERGKGVFFHYKSKTGAVRQGHIRAIQARAALADIAAGRTVVL